MHRVAGEAVPTSLEGFLPFWKESFWNGRDPWKAGPPARPPPTREPAAALSLALTGHLQADPVAKRRAEFVSGEALVFPFVLLRSAATAEVNHQGPRPSPHGHPGVLGNVEESAVACPVKAADDRGQATHTYGAGMGQFLGPRSVADVYSTTLPLCQWTLAGQSHLISLGERKGPGHVYWDCTSVSAASS